MCDCPFSASFVTLSLIELLVHSALLVRYVYIDVLWSSMLEEFVAVAVLFWVIWDLLLIIRLLGYLMDYCGLGLFAGPVLMFYLLGHHLFVGLCLVWLFSFSISRIWLYVSVTDVLCLYLWFIIAFTNGNSLVTHMDFLLPCIRIVFVVYGKE